MKNIKLTLLSIICLFFISCGDSALTASEATAAGWDSFESGDYEAAIDNFDEAIGIDASAIEAHVGKTFAYAFLGQVNLALAAAETGIEVNSQNADLQAASGFLKNAQSDFVASNVNMTTALNLNSNWAFARGVSLSVQDIHITMAQNYFNLENYQSCLNSLKQINSNYNFDIDTDSGRALMLQEIENFNKTLVF